MSPRKKRKISSDDLRINIVFLLFIGAFLVVIIKLFNIQVIDHSDYRALAEDQYMDQSSLPAKRGDILTSDGYLLVSTKTHYLLFAEPLKIKDPHQLATDISNILVDSRYSKQEISDEGEFLLSKEEMFKSFFDEIYKPLNQELMWVPVIKDLTPEEKESIEDIGVLGLGFEDFPVRYYPEGNMASHILGYVASNEEGERTGYFGVEGRLNDDLKGKPGRLFEEIDALGSPILVGSYKKIPPVQGRNVVLTINRPVQYMIEKMLKDGVEKYNAESGTIIVMNPFTGEVIGMANYPDYYPGNYYQKQVIDENTDRKNIEVKNSAISDTYEPGSVMKPLTISSAIDLSIVSPSTTFVDSGPVRYSDYTIDNWDGKHHGVQTITELLQKSNNIGASWVGHQVGRDNMYKYFLDFGIGARTGIDLEGEDTGILREKDQWTDIDLANISFGQGVSATSLQVLNSFNAIANGGFLLQPKIISKIVDENGETEIPVKNIRRVMSKETSDTMVDLLEKAAEGGEAKYFIMKDYRIAGKTGTAQIPEEGRYSLKRTNATFSGFLVSSKAFSMIVRLEVPKTSVYAAETSVPLWMDVASELVKFYGIPPDEVTVEIN